MTEEPSSLSTEGNLAPCSLSINSTNTQFVMASKGPQRKLLSPSTPISGSENCNPNVIHGSCKRKINNCPKSSATEQFLESNNAPKHLTSQACTEFNLISPPCKHVCSSRRCASNNSDYAVPATVNPKKVLVSKRHLLPPKGATMCKCCLWKSKAEDSAADDELGSMELCNRCSHESQKRRWSSDDSASRQLTENGEPMPFSLDSSEWHGKNAIHYPDSGQIEHASMNEAIREIRQESSTDTPKSWNRQNDSPNLQRDHVDTQDHHLKAVRDANHLEDSTPPTALASFSGSCGSESKHRAAYFNKHELQASPLPAGEGLYRFGASGLSPTPEPSSLAAGDYENSSLMPENEEAAVSPSPEKSGNWRLNAVLESFGNLSPTREGRVKTLVRAFESLLSVTERKGEQQARKPRGCPLKFSYLSSNANLDGEENSQREDFTDGWGGESDKEEATHEEERVGQCQTNVPEGDANDEEICDRWQRPHAVPLYSQSVVEDQKKYGMVEEQWLQAQEAEQECAEAVSDEEEDAIEKHFQKQAAQEVNPQSVVEHKEKGGMGEQWQLSVVADNEKCGMGKRWQEHEEERESAQVLREGVNDKEVGDMEKRVNDEKLGEMQQKQRDGKQEDVKEKQPDEHHAEGVYAQVLREGVNDKEVGDMEKRVNDERLGEMQQKQRDGKQEDVKEKQLDEHHAEGVYAQTLEKGYETDKEEQQPPDIVHTQSLLIEDEAEMDRALQGLEVKHIPAFLVNPMEAAFESHLPNQKIRANIQQHSSQKSIDEHFASTVARKKQSNRIRETRRGSNCSISSTRLPLVQKSQTQLSQDKPRLSKPQPFKLLTEARGHMKEQEFMMRLRKILEEEEKLRVPLAQGLPWTTDEPEIPHKPPVKENTKPLDVHLNSDIRAMERADFDRFIAEKLLYIEERRMEEESRRRAAEEEEIKKIRQDMVPKAQLMPYFDRPFRPRRSSKRPTIPKEPQFLLNKQQPKRQKCVANST